MRNRRLDPACLSHPPSPKCDGPFPHTAGWRTSRQLKDVFGAGTSLAALALSACVLGPSGAKAACVLTSGPGTATNPGTGAVVTCNTAPPNPATQPITAQPTAAMFG